MQPAAIQWVEVLAGLAGSFLLLLLFGLLLAACAALWLLGKGLGLARARAPQIAILIQERVVAGEQVMHRSAVDMVRPQIEALSNWEGVKAGVRTLIKPSPPSPASPASAPPPRSTHG
jgi:hypothetical protein